MNKLAMLAMQRQMQQPAASPSNSLAQAAIPPQPAQTMAEQVSEQPEKNESIPQGVGNFNGTFEYQGEKIQVKNGTASNDGLTIFISDDGKIVTDNNHIFVGTIAEGEFHPATPEMVRQLQNSGVAK